MLLGEIVVFKGWELTFDLIVLDIPYFDMILDIDTVSKYRAKIDYKRKKLGST